MTTASTRVDETLARRSRTGQPLRVRPTNSFVEFRRDEINQSISARFEKPVLWVFGSEGAGLSPSVRRHVERRIAIPLAPPVESLNVAVAAGVILFTTTRQSRAKPT